MQERERKALKYKSFASQVRCRNKFICVLIYFYKFIHRFKRKGKDTQF